MAINDAPGGLTPPEDHSVFDRLANILGGLKLPAGAGRPRPDEDEEEGMARMSFLDHLEELRHRLLMVVYGLVAAFCVTICFANQMWDIVREPARTALVHLGVNPPNLVLISPMDSFQIIWMKLPLLAAIFLASPWVLYQLWAFIAPGLYKHERKWAVPFVTSSAGLFIGGGLFAYFVAFRYGLEFLLGLGMQGGITPGINVNEYYDLFVDVMLAVGIVFEIPVLLFLLTLVRVANPGFLVRHSRYAILAIVILAAVITPTGDVFNLTLFATPMILLFYVGIFASWLLVLHREKRSFPWAKVLPWVGLVVVLIIIIVWVCMHFFGFRFIPHLPYFVRGRLKS
jgi:sec-independent protein translocase protein TatC